MSRSRFSLDTKFLLCVVTVLALSLEQGRSHVFCFAGTSNNMGRL